MEGRPPCFYGKYGLNMIALHNAFSTLTLVRRILLDAGNSFLLCGISALDAQIVLPADSFSSAYYMGFSLDYDVCATNTTLTMVDSFLYLPAFGTLWEDAKPL